MKQVNAFMYILHPVFLYTFSALQSTWSSRSSKLRPHTEDCYPGQPHRFKIKPLIKALFRRSVKQTKKEKVSWVNTDKHEANNNREQELILTRLLSLARHLPSDPLTATGE